MTKKEYEPGTYYHDASLIARLGYYGTWLLTSVGVAVESIALGFDLIDSESYTDNLAQIGKISVLGVAGMVGFDFLSQHYNKKYIEKSGQQG